MSYSRVLLTLAIVSALGCSKNSNSNNPAAPTNPKETKTADESTDYSQSAILNLVQTNDKIKDAKNNEVSLKGTGTKSTYKIDYSFNSGSATSFKVLATSTHSQYSNCSGPQAKMLLKKQESSKEINIVKQYNVEPNTDYTLEVDFGKPSCSSLKMTFDVLAWVGTPFVEPKTALVCESNQVGQTTFVMNVNLVTAFSSVVGKEKFLAMDYYCGENFRRATTKCSGSANLGMRDNSSSWSTVQCSAEKDGEKRAFTVDFNTQEESAIVNCQTNDAQTFSETFRSCDAEIVDYKPYAQFLME